MTVTREVSLRDFEFWSGGKQVAQLLTPDELDLIETLLEDCCDGTPFSETQINDFFWFDTDILCDWLDITEDELFSREMPQTDTANH